MSGDPATIWTALCHLWAWRPRAGQPAATSASSTSHAEAAGCTNDPSPMSATSTCPGVLGAVPQQQTRLVRRERHRPGGPHRGVTDRPSR